MKTNEIDTTKRDVVENNCDSISIHYRSNLGDDSYLSAEDLAEALTLAKQHRISDNHMVCIESGFDRTHRWDRDRVTSSNRWRKVDPDEMEVLGRIRTVSCS